jgi:hypothetical protein
LWRSHTSTITSFAIFASLPRPHKPQSVIPEHPKGGQACAVLAALRRARCYASDGRSRGIRTKVCHCLRSKVGRSGAASRARCRGKVGENRISGRKD